MMNETENIREQYKVQKGRGENEGENPRSREKEEVVCKSKQTLFVLIFIQIVFSCGR